MVYLLTNIRFTTKVWWSIFRNLLEPIKNHNILSTDKVGMVAVFKEELELNIQQIIVEEIREKSLFYHTALPFQV